MWTVFSAPTRLDAAEHELQAIAGLATGRVRLAAFPSAFATVVPNAVTRFTASYPGLELTLVEAEPPSALRMLRAGEVDVAMVFAHEPHPTADTDGLRTTALFQEPLFLVLPPGTRRRRGRLADHANDAWIAGCERCRVHLLEQCTAAGFTPRIAFSTDDYVTVQSLVAAGVGVSTLPALALVAHRHPDVVLTRLPGEIRHVLAATYGDPPDPPAVTAILTCLAAATESAGDWSP